MHEKIWDIQNSVWKAYTNYKKDGNISQYNRAASEITKKYMQDPLMLQFAENILISWAPVLNAIADEVRNGKIK